MGNILTKELLLRSVEEWNKARDANPELKPDLSGTDLHRTDLRGVNFRGADLRVTDLSEADLRWADLGDSDLRGAYLCRVNLSEANLSKVDMSYVFFKRGADGVLGGVKKDRIYGTDLTGANLHAAFMPEANLNTAHLQGADLSDALLSGANLSGVNFVDADLNKVRLHGADLQGAILIRTKLIEADLSSAEIKGAILSEANFSRAAVDNTTFGAVDLSSVIGLDTLRHKGPSTIGIDTIYASNGNIPEVFLRGCGVPDNFIDYARSLTAKAFDYYSCFISHSTSDKVFADRLHADLQAKGVRCWYAPHDMEGGEHIDTQIDRAIKVHEKVLLVLSESSINSNWVKREIAKAVKREEAEGKRVLFPISLVEFSTLEQWEFVDSKGRDLSEEIRKFYIPNFKGWENDNSLYTTEFDKLLKAFKDKSKQ
ncbi:toll/interleukin-1 receptor domain-containing protein [Chlorobaculum sp. 24CR]|uniref:toll/interleukin-1 receptor domain-containing protein n=1 Tax=Chlorobaculum sp. 24CR TaxID=2508878 RepID=UPI00143072A5|nr:toll/interleukin-1 receptor domain-containing protein [Chlorobaculum sp. 24CR]